MFFRFPHLTESLLTNYEAFMTCLKNQENSRIAKRQTTKLVTNE